VDTKKVLKRLKSYACLRGYNLLADDFCQWVFLQNAEKPESKILERAGNWLLTDFLREHYGGGRKKDNENNRIFKKYGVGKVERRPTTPGARNYESLFIPGSYNKERFCSDEMPIDERYEIMERLNNIKEFVLMSREVTRQEKEVFNLFLLGFGQIEVGVLLGVSESRSSQIHKKLFMKIRAIEKFLD